MVMLLYAACITLLFGDNLTSVEEKQAAENQEVAQSFTSIRLRKETVNMLKERGRKSESYDDIIRRLLEKRRR
jgi:hypothetical protein